MTFSLNVILICLGEVATAAPAAGSADWSSGWARAALQPKLATIIVTAAIEIFFDIAFPLIAGLLDRYFSAHLEDEHQASSAPCSPV